MRHWSLSRSCGSPTAASPRPRTAATCARREPLHHRRTAPLRLRRSRGRPVPAGPLPGRSRQPAGQGSPHRRGRAVRHLPQPRRRRAGRRHPRPLITQLKELIDGTDALGKDKRAELRGVISTKPGLNRYLRVTPGGLLASTRSKPRPRRTSTANTSCAPPTRNYSAEDIALGYRQLLQVERGWRDMKQVIDLRPVYHRKEERIRAHVILCWLALLLARIAENATGIPGRTAPPARAASPSALSPAPPGPSASAPRSAQPKPPSSNSSASTRHRRSTSSPWPLAADQRKQAA